MVSVVFNQGQGFTAWDIKIDSPLKARNTNGIDIDGATDFTVIDSWFRTGDDDIAIKAPKGRPSSHMTFTHNHLLGGHGLTIGSETEAGVSENSSEGSNGRK
jgi:polygalacturonase